MHVLLGKKQIVLAALVAALGLAVFVNWYYTDSGAELFPEGSVSESDNGKNVSGDGAAQYVSVSEESEYFASVRLTRDTARAAAIEELQAVVANAAEGGEAVNNSAAAIEKLSNEMKTESDIESLVTARTGNECVAVIADSTVEVLVPASALSDTNVLAISDIINEVCNGRYENIKISGAAV